MNPPTKQIINASTIGNRMKKLKALFFDQYVSTPFNAPNTLLTSHYQQYEYCLAMAMTMPLQKAFLVYSNVNT